MKALKEKKLYSLRDLLAQCDPKAPMPDALQDWDRMAPVGLEQLVMSDRKPHQASTLGQTP